MLKTVDTYHAASWSDPCYTSSSDKEEENPYNTNYSEVHKCVGIVGKGSRSGMGL